jgi:hypothetical protein
VPDRWPLYARIRNVGFVRSPVGCRGGIARRPRRADHRPRIASRWNYTQITGTLGCQDWYTACTTTCGELDRALKIAAGIDTAAYIEVVTDTYAAAKLAISFKSQYRDQCLCR